MININSRLQKIESKQLSSVKTKYFSTFPLEIFYVFFITEHSLAASQILSASSLFVGRMEVLQS